MNWLILTGVIASALGLALFYYLMILAKTSPQKQLGDSFKMPDVRFRYTPDVLYGTFEAAGDTGRPLMLRYWLYDFGLMLCLTVVMMAVTVNAAPAGSWTYDLMMVLAVARTILDFCEDLLLIRLLRRYPARANGMARLAGIATTLKHALLTAWLALLFFLLVLSAFNIK